MRAIISWSVMVALLLGLVAILVPIVTEAAEAAKANAPSAQGVGNPDDDTYLPYQGERFDEFDWRLCKKLAKSYAGNMVISPISIKIALVLLYEGAQGQTAHELGGALQLPDNRSAVRDRFVSVLRSLQAVRPEYAFDISTRLIVDSSINPTQSYSSTVKTFYSADVVVANLTDSKVALKDINDWVSNVTHGHVKELLTDPDKLQDSIFLVLNALYFRGTWRQPFLQNVTRSGQFYTDIDKSVEVSYMNNVGRYRYAEADDLDAQILRLPYLGHKYAMYIILPRARAGIQRLIEEINPYILRRHIQEMEEYPVDVSIPKFKFDFTTHLEHTLRELGIRDIFDNTASFSFIARAKQWGQRLMVSDFVQKAGLEVDELGTTAHAVTEVEIGNKISDRTFHVRCPFIFMIEDETTGTPVFLGKVMNPKESAGILEPAIESAVPPRMGGESISIIPGPAPGKSTG